VIDLANDAPVSSSTSRSTPGTTTLNPPVSLTIPASSPHQESSTSTASDPGASTPMQGQQTDACYTASKESTSSSDDPSLSAVPAPVPGVLTELESDFALMLVTQLYHRHRQTSPTHLCPLPHQWTMCCPAKWKPLWVMQQRLHTILCKIIRIWLWQMSMGNRASHAG